MRNSGIKMAVNIVAGVCLFFLLGRFAAIPGPAGTVISMQYGLLSVMAALSGSLAGGLIGLLGQLLIELSTGGIGWSRILASCLYGVLAGQIAGGTGLAKGALSLRDLLIFNLFQLAAHAAAWFLAVPCLHMVLYGKPAEEAFRQGMTTGVVHMMTTVIIGSVLYLVVATVRQKDNENGQNQPGIG